MFRVSIVDLAGIEDAVALARSVGKELGSDSGTKEQRDGIKSKGI